MDNRKSLIKGVRSRLLAQSAITGIVGQRVYTAVPENPTYPFIWFKVSDKQADTKTENMQECEILFNFYSDKGSDDQNLDIAAAVYTALHEQEANITLDAGVLTLLHYKGESDNMLDSDGVTRLGVATYEALLN